MTTRSNNRTSGQMRPVSITRHYTSHAEGSVLICFGETKVLCTASIQNKVPPHRKENNKVLGGWITAEYGMLPRATHTRMDREAAKGKQSGRTQEIQRLIGRSLRAAFDLDALGEHTLQIDCDVIQADGGTRTASITGAYVAAYDACSYLVAQGRIAIHPAHANPNISAVAAVSIGIVNGQCLSDLDYVEDSACDADVNVVMNAQGNIIEVQGTAEGAPFSKAQLDELLTLAGNSIAELVSAQKAALGI